MRTTFAVFAVLTLLVYAPGQAQRRSSRILIDASRDGGTWWSPVCSWCRGRHQGYNMVRYLRGKGAQVEELAEGTVITDELLTGRDVVIRAGSGHYSDISVRILGAEHPAGELAAYRQYVEDGGKLLLLMEYLRPGQRDSLAESFGLQFAGISQGENRIDRFAAHAITRGVKSVSYNVGSGLVMPADHVTMLGFLSKGTYLDLNSDGRKNAGEPEGAGVLGILEFGRGVVVFLGDVNTLQTLPQPLTDNLFKFLMK